MEQKNYSLIFKALSDETRRGILKELSCNESVCVCILVNKFQITQSKLSYHLKLLFDAGLVSKTSKGTWNYYSVKKDFLEQILSEQAVNDLLEG